MALVLDYQKKSITNQCGGTLYNVNAVDVSRCYNRFCERRYECTSRLDNWH